MDARDDPGISRKRGTGPIIDTAIAELVSSLRACSYIADRALATTLQISLRLEQPLLVEGPAGVGKTALAKVLAQHLGARLIRLQCYEGLDQSAALYEWDYPRQLLAIRLAEARGGDAHAPQLEGGLYRREFLLERPLLSSITAPAPPPVLLIDEIDRADEEFEAFLLEFLGEFQVTIPELGTLCATQRPRVVLTSNRTRELSDALRRRCLYHWIPYPDPEQETEILRAHLPGLETLLASQIARFMERLRQLPLGHAPGLAESLDWARALQLLGRATLDREAAERSFGAVLKDREDLELVLSQLDALIAAVAPGVGAK